MEQTNRENDLYDSMEQTNRENDLHDSAGPRLTDDGRSVVEVIAKVNDANVDVPGLQVMRKIGSIVMGRVKTGEIENVRGHSNIASLSRPSFLPGMYGRWTLDCVIEVARSVSLDFVSRPRHYRRIPEDTAIILESFKALVGITLVGPTKRSAQLSTAL